MVMSVPQAAFELLKTFQVALVYGCVLLASVAANALTADEVNQAGRPAATKSKVTRPSASIVKAQVLLVRQGVSPGEIDGLDGDNYRKAVDQFRRRENLGTGEIIDASTWQALKRSSRSGPRSPLGNMVPRSRSRARCKASLILTPPHHPT
jgi:peptidoglycan hydrolase-like protein with peptidoglycan-binding domain